MADEMGIQIEGREAGAAGGYKDTPYYKEELADITGAMEKSAASRGLLQSGGTIKAIGQRAGQYASRSRESYLDRLYGISGMGYKAATDTARMDPNLARSRATEKSAEARASSYMSSAQARAQGTLGSGAAIAGGIEGIGEAVGFGLGGYDKDWGRKEPVTYNEYGRPVGGA